MFYVPPSLTATAAATALVVITSALTVQAEIRLPQWRRLVQPIVRPMTKSMENMHREHNIIHNNIISSPAMSKPPSARDRIRHTLETFLPSSTMGHNLFLHAATKVKTLFQRSHLAPQAAWQSTGDVITVFGIEGDECLQATVSKNMESLFVSFASLQKGGCYSQGFREKAGMETLFVPFQGDVKIRVFKRSNDIVQSRKKCNGSQKPACIMAAMDSQPEMDRASQPQIPVAVTSHRQPVAEPPGLDTQLHAEPFPRGCTFSVALAGIILCVAVVFAVLNHCRVTSTGLKDSFLSP